MALTKANLRTLTKQALGNRTSSAINDAWYDERVYNGYRRLATFQGIVAGPGVKSPTYRRLRFYELRSRDSRTLTSALADNFVTPTASSAAVVLDVYDRTNDRALNRVADSELLGLNPDETGVPRIWCPAGKGGLVGYYIWPKPGTSADDITVYEYSYKYPAAFASDAATPEIPDAWHMGIVHAAVAEGAMLLDMPEKALEAENRFTQYIAERRTPVEDAGYSGQAGARRYIPVGWHRS